MLDLAFLIILIYIIFRSLWGYYNETLCNVALVIGILAGVLGFSIELFQDGTRAGIHMAVLGIAIVQKYAARHFAKIYNDKIRESREKLEKELEAISRSKDNSELYRMNMEDFDNEEQRFGKGGFTDNKP